MNVTNIRAPRETMFVMGHAPETCPHAWEPNLWEPGQAYCPLCASNADWPDDKRHVPVVSSVPSVGKPWAWAVVDEFGRIPCDDGGTCDRSILLDACEANAFADAHRTRLYDDGTDTDVECNAAVSVVPLYPRAPA